jgi:CysZ protein
MMRRMGVLDGLKCFFRGFALLARTPEAYPFALVPAVVALLLTTGLAVLSWTFVPDLVGHWVGTGTWYLTLLQVVATIALFALTLPLGLSLAQPLSGPALEALVRRIERRLGRREAPEISFVREIGRSLGSAALTVGGALGLFAVTVALGLVPGGVIIALPLQLLGSALLVGWDVCDYPMSVRGVPLGARLAWMRQHLWAVVGFSAGLILVGLIPCGMLLILPIGVAGATALIAEGESR